MGIQFELINGLSLGIEHINAQEETEDLSWMVVFHLLLVRIILIKFKEE